MNRIGFSQRLELRQSQALVMTPQLQQAIKLLQLSNMELADYIEHELEQNPLLERDEGANDPAAESGGIDAQPDVDAPPPDPARSDVEHHERFRPRRHRARVPARSVGLRIGDANHRERRARAIAR